MKITNWKDCNRNRAKWNKLVEEEEEEKEKEEEKKKKFRRHNSLSVATSTVIFVASEDLNITSTVVTCRHFNMTI